DMSARLHAPWQGRFESFRNSMNSALEQFRRSFNARSVEFEATAVARDEAVMCAEAKSALLARVCDETQVLVKDILENLTVLRPAVVTENQERALMSTKGSCGAVLTLLDELIGYAQLEEGRVEESRSEFTLRRQLCDLKDLLRPQTVKRRQELSLVIEDN